MKPLDEPTNKEGGPADGGDKVSDMSSSPQLCERGCLGRGFAFGEIERLVKDFTSSFSTAAVKVMIGAVLAASSLSSTCEYEYDDYATTRTGISRTSAIVSQTTYVWSPSSSSTLCCRPAELSGYSPQ